MILLRCRPLFLAIVLLTALVTPLHAQDRPPAQAPNPNPQPPMGGLTGGAAGSTSASPGAAPSSSGTSTGSASAGPAAATCATQRANEGPYQIGIRIEPQQPTPFSLLTFDALLSPAVSDLFEFDWRINGRPMGTGSGQIAQLAARDLPPAADGLHWVSVTARGVRDYPAPDPRFQPVPRSLTVECSFRTG
jgi:hypothetical protein